MASPGGDWGRERRRGRPSGTAVGVGEGLQVICEPVGGVQLPAYIGGDSSGLAGALPSSLGDLGPSSLTRLSLGDNNLTSRGC